jgi:predicted nuclease with RNAse H fold
MPVQKNTLIVAGVDVGGPKKGFHAVALRDGAFEDKFASRDVAEVAKWCLEIEARAIGIDAPCHWSNSGRARPAERALMKEGIWCFATPTRLVALTHPTNHYGWMLNGEKLFRLLEASYPLCQKVPVSASRKLCFETFPHAITWALVTRQVSAREKRVVRRTALEKAGVDTARLTNIDLLDAALCAFTAHATASGSPCKSYGDSASGLIIVPAPL